MIKVGFKRLTDDAILPVKAHATDSGFDLFANEDVIIEPGETRVIKTGVAVKLPPGYEAQVRPRSGVTSKTKLRVQLGTIDNDYTGEIGIIVDNTETRPLWNSFYIGFRGLVKQTKVHFINGGRAANNKEVKMGTLIISKGDKLAQLVIAPVPLIESYEVDDLPVTERGANGFGSSGY